MAPTRYTDVESRFVRKQIAEGSYEDADHRAYGDDLVAIERFVKQPPSGFGAGMHFGVLRSRHPGAYDIVQEELDPEGYAARKRQEAERRSERRAVLGRSDGDVAVERREWQRVAEAFEPR